MCVHTDVFVVFFSDFCVFVGNRTDLLRVESSVAVYNVDAVCITLADHLECLINVCFLGVGYCHNVTGYFVSFLFGILDHLDCCRHLVNVGCDADHVDDTFAFVKDVLLVIAASDVCHNGNLHVGIVVSDNRADGFLITEFPLAEFVYVKKLLGSLITKLHDVDTRFHVGAV